MTMDDKVAIWISETMTDGSMREWFALKGNVSKFRLDFDIDAQTDFFDEDHLVILRHELADNTLEAAVSDYFDHAFWSRISSRLKKKMPASKVNFLLAAPGFSYSGKVKDTGGLVFLGNFTCAEKEDVAKYFDGTF
ncbi:MAG: hypothetical protein ABN482_11975 [Corticimicrobacter sp.]|uniref:hypothetical protein n=1 Tax=Corticimicrobacter sp. TaxID=2678536 RepID=UPI0032DAB327